MKHIAPRTSRSCRRATVTVALLIALVILQLIVVGVANGGARDHDLSAQRMSTLRAFYAAESGMEMALREVMNNADEDGDGTIGTISGDGNSSNDPTVGGAQFHVTKTVAGADTTLDSQGRFLSARHGVWAVYR